MIDLEYKSEEISQERKQKRMKNIIETPGKEKGGLGESTSRK